MSNSTPQPHDPGSEVNIPQDLEAAPRLVPQNPENKQPIFAFILYIAAALLAVVALVVGYDADSHISVLPLWSAAAVVGAFGIVTQLLQRIHVTLERIREELARR